jgi:hypothetical protein
VKSARAKALRGASFALLAGAEARVPVLSGLSPMRFDARRLHTQ